MTTDKKDQEVLDELPTTEADFQNVDADKYRAHDSLHNTTIGDKLQPEAVELYIASLDYADPNDNVKPFVAAKLRTFVEYLRDESRGEFHEQSKTIPETS